MTHNATLIILSTTKIKENALVLHTLSSKFGRRSFIASISRQAPAALFQPMSLIESEISENPKSQLWRVRNISFVHPLNSIRSSVYKNTIALFMSEVLYRSIKDGEGGGEELFNWARKSIFTLEEMQSDFSNYHLRFLLEFGAILGFNPAQAAEDAFEGEYREIINDLIHKDFASSMMIRLNGAQRGEIAGIIVDYISTHTESTINIQSLKVLREIFA